MEKKILPKSYLEKCEDLEDRKLKRKSWWRKKLEDRLNLILVLKIEWAGIVGNCLGYEYYYPMDL